jgi:peptidoglycan hydrolase-like protein with peptidoglycan-binding domain
MATKTITDDAFVRLFQERFGLTVDGWAGKEVLAKLDQLAPQILLPAQDVIPDDYWPMLAQIESGNRPYIQAASSSASGLYQFIRSTWLGEGGRWGPTLRPAFGGLKPTPEEQLLRAKSFTAKNAEYLRRQGIPINKASLYAAHFFGPITAAAVIGAHVNARADTIAGPAATKANPSILKGKTVGQFLSWLHKKTGDWAR